MGAYAKLYVALVLISVALTLEPVKSQNPSLWDTGTVRHPDHFTLLLGFPWYPFTDQSEREGRSAGQTGHQLPRPEIKPRHLVFITRHVNLYTTGQRC